MKTGSVVYSKSGHDLNETYAVIGFNEKGYVILSDGKRRPLDKPKIKNPKHLKYIGQDIPELTEKLEQGKLKDSDLIWFLKPYQN